MHHPQQSQLFLFIKSASAAAAASVSVSVSLPGHRIRFLRFTTASYLTDCYVKPTSTSYCFPSHPTNLRILTQHQNDRPTPRGNATRGMQTTSFHLYLLHSTCPTDQYMYTSHCSADPLNSCLSHESIAAFSPPQSLPQLGLLQHPIRRAWQGLLRDF